MKFWFCEKCGKRITDDDFEEGKAADKQARGIFCDECAVGIPTGHIDPVTHDSRRTMDPAAISTATTPSMPVLPVLTAPAGKPRRSSRLHLKPEKPPSDRKPEPLRSPARPLNTRYMLGGALLALAIVVLFFLLSGPAHNPQVAAHRSDSANAGHSRPERPAVRTTHAAPGANSGPLSPLPLGSDPDRQADTAFDALRAKLKTLDKEAQAEALEDFVASYGNSIVASRARKMLGNLKRESPAKPAQAARPPQPPPQSQAKRPAPPAQPPVAPAPNESPPDPEEAARAANAANAAALRAYASFQSDFLGALRSHDGQRAKAVLEQAQKNEALAAKQPELAGLKLASDWIAELDAAIPKGVERLKELDDFTLPVARGAPVHVGKSAEFKFTELKDNQICIENKGLTLSVPLSGLPESTRSQLAELGLGDGPHARVLHAFVGLLTAPEHRADAAEPARAALQKSLEGAPAAEAACVQLLSDCADAIARERAAERAWKELARVAGQDYTPERAAQIKTAVDAFRAAFSATAFAANHGGELSGIEALEWEIDPRGLLIHLTCDDLQGAALADASSQNRPGAAVNGPVIAPGKWNGALRLNGTQYATFPDLIHAYPIISLSVWFNTRGDGVILGQNDELPPQNSKAHAPIAYVGTDGKLHARFFQRGPMHPVAETPVNDGRWHHLGIATNKTGQIIYLDGVQVATVPGRLNSTLAGAHNQLGVGFAPGQPATNNHWFYFKGLLDDFRLYDRTLTDEEMRRLAGKN